MRIFLYGDEEVAKQHIAIVKSRVNDFVSRTRRSNLKINNFAFSFEDTKTHVYAVYAFDLVSVRIYSEPTVAKKEEKKKEVDEFPSIIVASGDEVLGYNVAKIRLSGSVDDVAYFTAASFSDILSAFTPMSQVENTTRRYALRSDRAFYEAEEFLIDEYATTGTSINLLGVLAGRKCTPTIAARCPELPAGDSEIYECQQLYEEITADGLDSFLDTPITQEIVGGFAARSWCYGRNTGTYKSYWATKREVTFSTEAAVKRIQLGIDVRKERGISEFVQATANSVLFFYGLFADEFACTSSWVDSSQTVSNALAAAGGLLVEELITPIGPARTIGYSVENFIHSFYNSDENFLAYGHSEPFTLDIPGDVFSRMISAGVYDIGMLAYSLPNLSLGGNYSSFSHKCPDTRYKTALEIPGYVTNFDNTGVSYCNLEAKGCNMNIETVNGNIQIYFKNLLLSDFSYDAVSGIFEKTATTPVTTGACSCYGKQNNAVIDVLHAVFTKFREDDIANEKITGDEAYATYGSVMVYAYDPERKSSYLADEVQLFNLINALRGTLGVAPLALNYDLCIAARIHAEDMARENFLGHEGSDGTFPPERIDASGFCGGAVENLEIGENCGQGYTSAQAQLDGWIASTDHYNAMINSKFREVGIALAVRLDGGTQTAFRCAVFAGDSDL